MLVYETGEGVKMFQLVWLSQGFTRLGSTTVPLLLDFDCWGL